MTRLKPHAISAAAIAVAAAVAAACGESTTQARPPLNLERPVDIAFSCWGGLRLTGGGAASADDPLVETGQPMASCRLREQGMAPPGQENLEDQVPVPNVGYLGFVLQSVPGTVGLLQFPAKPVNEYTSLDVAFLDADSLTPGRNSITVGALPVAIATDRAGCHVVTANAGSCDLSVLEIDAAVDFDPETTAVVRAVTVENAAGEPVLARAAAMVAAPGEDDQPIGVECPAEPEGLFWIAYPDCHLVAGVRVGTGQIESAIRFNDDGTVEITDGDVSCPAQCGGGGVIVPGERPVTVDIEHDARVGTRRMVIGAENSSILTVVELDEQYLPQSIQRLPLEGDIGVVDLAISPQIGIGGSSGMINDATAPGGQQQFVYAVATDATVRVADILGVYQECDTQVDPRYLRGVADIGRLSCLPVGDPETPPRRATAAGPGIDFVGGSVPLSVDIVRSETFSGGSSPDPLRLTGYFAFVTTATGETIIVNVDDDDYLDLWNAGAPLATMLASVMPHQVRDALPKRDDVAVADQEDGEDQRLCSYDDVPSEGGPHLASQTSLNFDQDRIDPSKGYAIPSVRRLRCDDGVTGEASSIFEVAFEAPPEVRDLVFPDLRAVRYDETWTATWEGPLSRDGSNTEIDGPVLRAGLVSRDGGALVIEEPSRPFCDMGVQPWDIAALIGCDPAQGDAQCGLGETCYVHPDATVASGACLPDDKVSELAGPCRDFLVSRRRFSVTEAEAGELRLVPRRVVLATTPLDGCTGDDQCAALALYDAQLASGEHPQDDETEPPPYTYACAPDPSRSDAVANRCQMTCETSEQCIDGSICAAGFCVEGALPPAECVPGVQRFTVRGGEAFIVVGASSGYLHGIVEDPATGACVLDPDASPLLVGRIPLVAPPCTGDGFTDLTPNPCSTTVEHTELVPDYVDPMTSCAVGNDNGRLITRDAPAIRFSNPSLTFHLVDPWYPGDARCREDRAGSLVNIPVVHPGVEIAIPIVAGFFTQRAGFAAVFPVRVVRGPSESIWVIDEGDDIPDSSLSVSTRGQVFRVEPGNLGIINVVQ